METHTLRPGRRGQAPPPKATGSHKRGPLCRCSHQTRRLPGPRQMETHTLRPIRPVSIVVRVRLGMRLLKPGVNGSNQTAAVHSSPRFIRLTSSQVLIGEQGLDVVRWNFLATVARWPPRLHMPPPEFVGKCSPTNLKILLVSPSPRFFHLLRIPTN